MYSENHGGKLSNLAPLILRLAVAGVFCMAGLETIRPEAASEPAIEPIPVADALPSETAAELGSVEPESIDVPGKIELAKRAAADLLGEENITLNVPRSSLIGYAQLAFAGVLFIGLLTRFASLAGLGTAAWFFSGAGESAASTGMIDSVRNFYQANSPAMRLFAAVCLSLLVSGSGPLAIDRLLFRKKKQSNVAAESVVTI